MYSSPESMMTIKLQYGASNQYDGLPEHTIEFKVPFEELTVHGWFSIFEKLVNLMGFSETNVMRGATELAFREGRKQDDMRVIAKEYDLKLVEDLTEENDEQA